MKTILTAERLRALLHYDPATGVFQWVGQRRGVEKGAMPGTMAGPYWVIQIDYRAYLAHRLAWLYMTGEMPTLEIDHRNTIKTDNRWDNLRLATKAQNGANRGPNKNNTTGAKGVTFDKRRGGFIAQISVGGQHKWLGCFPTTESASAAYAKAAVEHYGEYAKS